MSRTFDVVSDGTDATVDAIVDTIASATTEVRTAIAEEREYLDSQNDSGDDQLAADVRADELFEHRLLSLDGVGTYASEEREKPSIADGTLHVAMDPLDGSSNLQPNGGMGSIFAVYDERPPTSGRNLVAAGFVMYGPVTTLVVARDGSVREYLIHDGEARVVDDDVTIPDEPTVYGFGGGVDSWTDEFGEFAEEIQRELKLRYGGAMIGDVSKVLTYGGIFSYPALESSPDGKLRLVFEGHPMAYIVESAGGASSDGEGSLLDAEPEELHARTPLHLGDAELIDLLEAALS